MKVAKLQSYKVSPIINKTQSILNFGQVRSILYPFEYTINNRKNKN